MSSEAVISARGLGKAYRIYRHPEDRLKELVLRRRYHEDFWAVREVDLSVRAGETVGLIGRNGSGKSTLLQLICGTVRPTRGALEVKGRIGALLELGAGFNPEFTGRENVWVNAAVLGLSDQAIAARFEAIAAFAGIGEYMDQPVKHYSSGMHARLAFAVCAHVDADILVVDEALSVGDGAFQQKCMRRGARVGSRARGVPALRGGAFSRIDGGERGFSDRWARLVRASAQSGRARRSPHGGSRCRRFRSRRSTRGGRRRGD